MVYNKENKKTRALSRDSLRVVPDVDLPARKVLISDPLLGTQFANVDASGNLKVASTIVTPPTANIVIQVAKSNMSGTVDTMFTITNGTTLTIQILSGGSETTNAGAIVELFEDPNGDLSVLNIIDDVYVNGSSSEKNLTVDFIGDGTRRIVLRRRLFSGGTIEITGRWEGFEE